MRRSLHVAVDGQNGHVAPKADCRLAEAHVQVSQSWGPRGARSGGDCFDSVRGDVLEDDRPFAAWVGVESPQEANGCCAFGVAALRREE